MTRSLGRFFTGGSAMAVGVVMLGAMLLAIGPAGTAAATCATSSALNRTARAPRFSCKRGR